MSGEGYKVRQMRRKGEDEAKGVDWKVGRWEVACQRRVQTKEVRERGVVKELSLSLGR